MKRKSRENPAIREFIIDNVEGHPNSIANIIVDLFKVTRVTANRYLQKLASEGLINATGATRARSYSLKTTLLESFSFEINSEVAEDVIYRDFVEPHLSKVSQNVLDILQYGVSEMVNNVVDHSEGSACLITVKRTPKAISINIADNGIGIFRKIQKAHNLMDERHAILELSKGKLTTDPSRHSGEGIFFTSRMFRRFTLYSCDLVYQKKRAVEDHEFLLEAAAPARSVGGTIVYMEIDNEVDYTMGEIFKLHEDDDSRFSKTHVPVTLARYGEEKLVSRSQAKRVLARFEHFSEVMLDFSGVSTIGQAFADEIFRVYARNHPNVAVIPVLASEEVKAMIRHVTGDQMIVADALSAGSNPV